MYTLMYRTLCEPCKHVGLSTVVCPLVTLRAGQYASGPLTICCLCDASISVILNVQWPLHFSF